MIGTVTVDKSCSNMQVLNYSGLYDFRDGIVDIVEFDTEYIISYNAHGTEICYAVEAHEDYAFEYPQEVLDTMLVNATDEGTSFVTEFLNSVAHSEGWGTLGTDSMTSARASAGPILDTDSEYAISRKTNANALDVYFYAVWEVANRIAEEVRLGARPLPTSEELITELPVFGE